MTTKDLAALRDQLIRHEGLRLRVYTCSAGKQTIGVGRNLEDKGITAEEAMDLLDHDIEECLSDLRTFAWFTVLDPVRQRAVIDFRFNLGHHKFRTFTRFLSAMETRDYARAGNELLHSLWATQVKGRAMRIIRQIRTGIDA